MAKDRITGKWITGYDCKVMEFNGLDAEWIFDEVMLFEGKVSVSAINYLRSAGIKEAEIQKLYDKNEMVE